MPATRKRSTKKAAESAPRRHRLAAARRCSPGALVVRLGARYRRRGGRHLDRCREGDAGQARAARRTREDGQRAARHARSRRALDRGGRARRSTSRIPRCSNSSRTARSRLPFEIILRLASVLGRNDPISFVMRFTRSYNPDVWQTLESLGHRPLRRAGGARARVREHLSRQRCRAPAVGRGVRGRAGVHQGGVRLALRFACSAGRTSSRRKGRMT